MEGTPAEGDALAWNVESGWRGNVMLMAKVAIAKPNLSSYFDTEMAQLFSASKELTKCSFEIGFDVE